MFNYAYLIMGRVNYGTGPDILFNINKLTLFFHSLLPWKSHVFGAYFIIFQGK